MKKVKRKPTKQNGDKEKTARLQKEAPEQDADAKPKKFSHSTMRRKVDKILLETLEDEIDYHKVPLRELILLEELKERQTAVQQFGTDLSLIQQLFPALTRWHVKLKYKKEERQHPLRLCEALTNRAKDHSHFETVIKRLQKIGAEENENADNDCFTELRGSDVAEEGIPDVNDEEAKNEKIGEEENEEDAGQYLAEVGSSLKSQDSEDDLFRWSQYKSDT